MAPGFDRGFDHFDAGFHQKHGSDEDRYHSIERRAGDVVAHAITWLGKNRQSPFFVWVHLYDPHAPYDPPAPYDKQFKDPYDGEVAYADAALGKLFGYLRRRGLFDLARIAVLYAHGEALGVYGQLVDG